MGSTVFGKLLTSKGSWNVLSCMVVNLTHFTFNSSHACWLLIWRFVQPVTVWQQEIWVLNVIVVIRNCSSSHAQSRIRDVTCPCSAFSDFLVTQPQRSSWQCEVQTCYQCQPVWGLAIAGHGVWKQSSWKQTFYISSPEDRHVLLLPYNGLFVQFLLIWQCSLSCGI